MPCNFGCGMTTAGLEPATLKKGTDFKSAASTKFRQVVYILLFYWVHWDLNPRPAD